MTDPIVVVGAGGFGREVIDVIEAINQTGARWEVTGVVDDAPSGANLERLDARGISYMGTLDELLSGDLRCHYTVGVGSPAVRRHIASRLDAEGFSAATLVHPTVTRGFGVSVGEGSVLCAGVRLTTNIVLGRHVHINLNSTVGHDTMIGDFVSVNPLASISGDCLIEEGVLVGVAGVVLNQVTIGRNATVGGGACVIRDVAWNTTVVGIPARPI